MAALATLPPRARAAVVLRYWADMSIEQVAAVLGCSAGTVKSQSSRALDKLRLLLDAASAEPAAGYPTEHPNGTREVDHGRDIASRTS